MNGLVKVDELIYPNLIVPVWEDHGGRLGAYSGRFILESDLPEDLREAFCKSQATAAMPRYPKGANYLSDFSGFMNRGGKSWYHDGSAVSAKYLLPPVMSLVCSSCGAALRGRQWHNRDVGFGLCPSCVAWIKTRESKQEMLQNYGVEGMHYAVEGINTTSPW